jgi:integrase
MPKRRANHEGTIYKRQDGRWVASITLAGGKRKSFYAQTRQEVAQKLTVGLKARLDGLPLPSDQLKVGRYLTEWLQSAQPSIRPSTWRRYEQLLRLHAIPALAMLPLTRLEPRHIQKLYADLLSGGMPGNTVRLLHAVLRRGIGQAVAWGTLPRNVVQLVSPPREQRHEMTPLSAEQARTLLEAAHGERLEALYVLALNTGMRIGELLGLRWRDMDLTAGRLHVQHTLVRTRGVWRLAEPKTARSRRRIALAPSAIDALRHHHARQAEERLSLGPAWENHDMVFANALGRPMQANHVLNRLFRPLLSKAGLPRIRFHDLRHTCASLMLRQGIHPKIVSEMLGHSSIGMTLDTYSHVIPDMQHQAVKAMDALLRG